METLRIAESAQDHEAAYRFWYDVYVSEMGRHRRDPLVSHERGILYDRLAARGTLYLATHEQQVIGTVLTTPLTEPFARPLRHLYGLNQQPLESLHNACVTTKLMVAPNWRRGRLMHRLIGEGYLETLRQGMRYNYMDCNDHLLRMFMRYGYRPHRADLIHPVYGRVNSLVADLTDRDHLARMRSPFLPYLDTHLAAPRAPANPRNDRLRYSQPAATEAHANES